MFEGSKAEITPSGQSLSKSMHWSFVKYMQGLNPNVYILEEWSRYDIKWKKQKITNQHHQLGKWSTFEWSELTWIKKVATYFTHAV